MAIINKGFKYRIYPTKKQAKLLEHQMFIYNQAYNIALNLKIKDLESNKELEKQNRKYLSAVQIDSKVKTSLKQRELPFKTVVTQQARRNLEAALKETFRGEKGFPKFKNSKKAKQSFNWNNQGFQLFDTDSKFATFRLLSQEIKLRYHRKLPATAKICSITISKQGSKFYAAFNVEYEAIVCEVSKDLDISQTLGIDMNIQNIGLSNDYLIPTQSKEIAKKKYEKRIIRLKRKQSRRVLKAKKTKKKLGANFRKTQEKINKTFQKVANQKKDRYHKISRELINIFDFIAVEDLKTKNMTKSAKGTLEKPGKRVAQKKGLNKSILDTSFYEFLSMLSYKAMHTGKIFVEVPPQYTSKGCCICGNINKELTLKDRVYVCECGNMMHRDVNAARNILRLGLESFGAGTALTDLNCKAFVQAA